MTTQHTIPLNELRIDKANVRATDVGADEGLLASIEAHGILVPLIVRPNGVGHLVTEGGRRLRALNALAKAGKIAKDFPVPVSVHSGSDNQARETSLATNLFRLAMHPVEAYRAFQLLHTDKEKPLDVEAIGRRFGLTKKEVGQYLALGALDDVILDAWRDRKISEDAAKAFTLCRDKKHQKELFASLVKTRGSANAWEIKSALHAGVRNAARMLEVVGLQEYEKKGGKIIKDLFGESHVFSDGALLQTMFEETRTAAIEQLKADGWGFVVETPKDYYTYGEINAKPVFSKDDTKRLAAIAKELKGLEREDDNYDDDEHAKIEALQSERDDINSAAKLRGYTAKQKAASGVFVNLDDLTFDYGRVPPKNVKPKEIKATAPGEKKKPAKLSQALETRLREQMLKATRKALETDKHPTALAKVTAGIVARQINPGRSWANLDSKEVDAIRGAITPALLIKTQRDVFDAKDYFESCPKSFGIKAVEEAMGKVHAAKLKGKKGAEIAKFAIANVVKTGWLPKELRSPGYRVK